MTWFTNCQSLEELKKTYKDLVKQYHPDLNPGLGSETMAKINAEYDKVFKELQKESKSKIEQVEMPNEYRDLIIKLLNLHGLKIEICGAWLWISGDTYGNKKALKEIGCQWASQKQMWFWRPEEAKCYHNRHTKDMDEIRGKYGSTVLVSRHPDLIPGH